MAERDRELQRERERERFKVSIKAHDMAEDMQQDAVEWTVHALEKYNVEKDACLFIKKVF